MEFNWIRRSEDVSRVNKFSIHDVAEAWCVWASQDEWCTIFTIQVRGGGAFRACVGPPGLLMFVWAIQPYNMLLRRLVQLTAPQSHHWSKVNVHRSLHLPRRSEENYDCTFFTETCILVVIHHLRLLTLVYGFDWFLRARLSLVSIRLFDDDVVWLRLDVCYAVAFLLLMSHQRQRHLRRQVLCRNGTIESKWLCHPRESNPWPSACDVKAIEMSYQNDQILVRFCVEGLSHLKNEVSSTEQVHQETNKTQLEKTSVNVVGTYSPTTCLKFCPGALKRLNHLSKVEHPIKMPLRERPPVGTPPLSSSPSWRPLQLSRLKCDNPPW